ncbi:unnamed protein product, partial [Cercopithifilaria johnstoni]
MWLARLALRSNYSTQMTAKRQITSSTKNQEKWRAKWNNFTEKIDFWKCNGDGLWGINQDLSFFIDVYFLWRYSCTYDVTIQHLVKRIQGTGWKGGNQFLWYAIENRFSHECAYA